MKVELLVAGMVSFVCALGHATVGLRWVLPDVAKQPLERTPFGPAEMTQGMVRVTWHIVTLMLASFGVLLTMLAFSEADVRMLLLQWFAALWATAAALMVWIARRRLRGFLRLPVPLLMLIVAVMCWRASA